MKRPLNTDHKGEWEDCFPDFWELRNCPGYFQQNGYVSGAGWLQDHPEDPYWLAHQIHGAVVVYAHPNEPDQKAASKRVNDTFMEAWILARDLKMNWHS